MPKVFISYNYYDQHFKKTIDNWREQGLGTEISFVSIDTDIRQQGNEAIAAEIKKNLDTAEIALVVVGDIAHNSPWIAAEVKYSTSTKKKVIWTRVPDTTGAAPEEIRSHIPIEFRLPAIQEAIRNCLRK